ncbi:hypothetical protein V6N13_110222 [Hibiscus sabdariffa]
MLDISTGFDRDFETKWLNKNTKSFIPGFVLLWFARNYKKKSFQWKHPLPTRIVVVHLRAIGDAPILKQAKFKRVEDARVEQN